MTIHASDPFGTPQHLRSPGRRLRGRLPAPVTLWTARHPRSGPAGLTVSSCLVVDGDPVRLVGVIDDESELWEAVSGSGSFVVSQLGAADQALSERFAGRLPTPGGHFGLGEWVDLPAGPVPAHLTTWAACRLDEARQFGWGLLVEATVVESHLGEPAPDPLVYHRGRYRTAR